MNITKIKKFIIGKDAYLKSLKSKYKEETLTFERIQDTLYNENDIQEYLEFIKEKCIKWWEISEKENKRIDEGLNEIKKASKEIKEYNDFIKYLAVFSKVDFEDEETEPMLYLFKIFYKLFKNEEIDLELYKENLQYYESVKEKEIKEFYEGKLDLFKQELPKDFYDDEEVEQIVFKILTEKNYDEREEYKKMLFSKLLKHYSNPSIIFNDKFVERAMIFNSYYLIYKVLNTKKYQDELSEIENKELVKELNKKREEEKKAKPEKHYHIRKTILIILFLLLLSIFGIAGKIVAFLILLYYALKGMLRGDDVEEW